MNTKFKIFIFFLVCFEHTKVIASDSPCGDWEQYKDEHCYKLFDSLVSYSDAEKTCQANNSSLVSIHYAEEQNFLTNFIFTKKKTVDNVWIGARFVGNKLFQWEDHAPLTGGYSNWAAGSPKNRSDYCVQMNGDPDSVGKWVDEPCARKNLAVCQRLPLPSIRMLAEALIALKHNLQQTTSELANTKKELTQTTNNLTETKKEFAKLKKEITITIPIGFIYVQLPKDKTPTELWPSLTWADVSKDYEGIFFRVVGGDAATFGQLQEDNAPRLEKVYSERQNSDINSSNGNTSLTIPKTGWSTGIHTGDYGLNTVFYIHFKHSDIAEVRPKNMAIKVFKRTA